MTLSKRGFSRVLTRSSFSLRRWVQVVSYDESRRMIGENRKDETRFRENATKPRAVVVSTSLDQRIATKYSFLAAVNGVVNDATSPSFVRACHRRLSRGRYHCSFIAGKLHALFDPRNDPTKSKLYNWTVVKTAVGQVSFHFSSGWTDPFVSFVLVASFTPLPTQTCWQVYSKLNSTFNSNRQSLNQRLFVNLNFQLRKYRLYFLLDIKISFLIRPEASNPDTEVARKEDERTIEPMIGNQRCAFARRPLVTKYRGRHLKRRRR